MYRMSNYEFIQYELAEEILEDICLQRAEELEHAYDGITPTVTRIDYDLGRIYPYSIDTAEYAIHIASIKEKYERIEGYWNLRAEKYKQAIKGLTKKEKDLVFASQYENPVTRAVARRKLRNILTEIVNETPDLQRKPSSELKDVQDYDRFVDNMSLDVLMEDYWDLDEQLETEKG